jgi:hypothetical protein
LLEAFRPGMTVAEFIDKTIEIGKKTAVQRGALANAKTSIIVHGRGLGDDRPLLLTDLDAKPMYDGTERSMSHRFPDQGVYIVKPTVATADKRYLYTWGDSVHLSTQGARRMGKHPPGISISEPNDFSGWPRDCTVYS